MWEKFKIFARDPFWQFAGVIVALAPFVYNFLSSNNKELVWEMLSDTPLLSDANNSMSDLKVYFNGIEVENPNICVFKITNTSNSAIVASDFDTNLKLTLNNSNAQILEVKVSERTKGLNPVHSFSDNEVSIKPLLLNSKDFFAIKILSSSPISDKNFSFSARIKDIKEIKQTSNSIFKKKLLDFLWLAPVTTFVSVIITGSQYETVIIFLLPIIIMVITILLFIYNIKK